MRFEESPQLTRRLQYVEEVKRQFWAKQVFQGRVLAQQWRKPKRDVRPGDVVMLAEAEIEDPVYHLGNVDSVKTGEDGHMRTVSIQYTNPGRNPQERSPVKVTTSPIHKIAVIVPVDYRFEDDQGPPATEQGRATREASPPPETPGRRSCPDPLAGPMKWRRFTSSMGRRRTWSREKSRGQCKITTTRLGERTRVGEGGQKQRDGRHEICGRGLSCGRSPW